jgi:hypothetical protein
MNRYQCGIPMGGSLSRTLARHSKSKSRRLRGLSAMPGDSFSYRSSSERYVPNSASDAYEQLLNSRRAKSVAFNSSATAAHHREHSVLSTAEHNLIARQRRTLERNQRAQSGRL